jgi:hypothetical protein
MPKAVDITGQRYGRLVAVKDVGVRNGHRAWLLQCDCGNETVATSNLVRRGCTQSCGCYRNEFLALGPNPHRLNRPTSPVKFTYPVPEILHTNPRVNEVQRRMMQWRWERVEFEAKRDDKLVEKIGWEAFWERTHSEKRLVPRDQYGTVIPRLDLKALAAAQKNTLSYNRVPIPEVPSSITTGASLADRIRVVSEEEWARLLMRSSL